MTAVENTTFSEIEIRPAKEGTVAAITRGESAACDSDTSDLPPINE